MEPATPLFLNERGTITILAVPLAVALEAPMEVHPAVVMEEVHPAVLMVVAAARRVVGHLVVGSQS